MKKFLIGLVVIVAIGASLWYFFTQMAQSPTPSYQEVQTNSPVATDPKVKNLSVNASQSKATYEIDEKLQGKPTRVVGTTQSITGQITVNLNEPNKIEIGTIKIDATSFKTDIAKRDENVNEMVLKSTIPANRYITFEPTSVIGVPATIVSGQDFPLTINGNMTILATTKPVVFIGTGNWSSDGVLTINAKNTLTYGDFGLVIPDFSFISDVEKTVDLTVSLVAK